MSVLNRHMPDFVSRNTTTCSTHFVDGLFISRPLLTESEMKNLYWDIEPTPYERWAEGQGRWNGMGKCAYCGGVSAYTNLRGGRECSGCGAPK